MRVSTKKKVPEEGIPRWFVTYSDVITLLMTFFILLLTFASNQPEGFEMMQQSLFGTGGSSGSIGKKLEIQEYDAFVLRVKPSVSRLTTHGSEIPPMYTDPVSKTASQGLMALSENNDLAQVERFSFETSMNLYLDENKQPTQTALRHLNMLAHQMQRLPLELNFTIPDDRDLASISRLAELMMRDLAVPAGRISVSLQTQGSLKPEQMRLTLRQQIQR